MITMKTIILNDSRSGHRSSSSAVNRSPVLDLGYDKTNGMDNTHTIYSTIKLIRLSCYREWRENFSSGTQCDLLTA